MRPTRKCEFCGKTFVPRSGMQKYCSEECQAEAKRLRKKRQQDLINGIEPIMDLQHQEYLTFSKAAVLMGCTRQYIYKLVANGKLKASRLSSRMAFVRKTDIEKMFEGNPYKRVVPASKSKPSKKAKAEKPTQNLESTKGKEENVGAYRDNPDRQGASFARRGYPLGIHSMLRPCIEASLPVLLPNGIEKERHQEAHLGGNTALCKHSYSYHGKSEYHR